MPVYFSQTPLLKRVRATGVFINATQGVWEASELNVSTLELVQSARSVWLGTYSPKLGTASFVTQVMLLPGQRVYCRCYL